MFQSVILLGHRRNADWANLFLQHLTQAFAEIGLDSTNPILGDGQDDQVADLIRKTPDAFLLDINAKIQVGDRPKFSLMVDHPLSHPQVAQVGPRTVLGCIDAAHAAIRGYADVPVIFCPHGGPDPVDGVLDLPRDIDCLFVGNLLPPPPAANQWEELALTVGRQVAYECCDPFDPLVAALEQQGVGLAQMGLDSFARLLNLATNEAQRLARIAVIRSIPKCALHVVGQLDADVSQDFPPWAVVHGFNASFVQSCQLMARSRVVLNVAQKFPAGSHERVWYGMAHGCAVVSSPSSFMQQDFVHDQHILYYSDPRQAGDMVAHALDGQRDRDLAAEALSPYRDGHTWVERAERIFLAMNGVG